MSILLDALKKSEEQRQLGKTPDIHDRDDYRPQNSNGGRTWIPLAMTAVAAVLIAALVWRQFEEPAPEDVSGEAVAGSDETASAGRRLPQIGTQVARQESEPAESASEARTPVESFRQADSPAGTSRSVEDASSQKGQDLARSVSEYQEPEPPPQQPAAADAAAAKTVARPPAEPAGQKADDVASPHQGAPVSYWELPQNVRDGMPETRLTVLVYAEKPEDRFLLMNGRRMVEDQAMEGLVLEEIRRDGAVFRYRNYRFLLKR